MTSTILSACVYLLLVISCQSESQTVQTSSLDNNQIEKTQHTAVLEERVQDIITPEGFQRIQIDDQSFGNYLRDLPLRKDRVVYMYNGAKKSNQSAQYAVIDRSPSNKDLMQCADAVMRLRSEFLFEHNDINEINFNFVSGDNYKYADYLKGITPFVNGSNVTWKLGNSNPNNRESLSNYLDWIYMYAGTASLIKELHTIETQTMQIGDVFIQSRNPYGHAIIVVDMCQNPDTNEIGFLLAQSYMPAQDLHILRNPNSIQHNPWYILNASEQLETPEWTFNYHDLKRF